MKTSVNEDRELGYPTSSLPSSTGMTSRMIDLTIKSLTAIGGGVGCEPAMYNGFTACMKM